MSRSLVNPLCILEDELVMSMSCPGGVVGLQWAGSEDDDGRVFFKHNN